MEENLANRSRAELETALRDSSRVLQAMLATQLRSFDDHFQHLLNDSERTLQGTFPGAFGELYTQNTKASGPVCRAAPVLPRCQPAPGGDAGRVLGPPARAPLQAAAPQLLLPDDYLDCLGKQAEALRPSGRPQESCACGPPAPSWLLAPSCKAWVWPVTWSARWLRSLWARSARGLS